MQVFKRELTENSKQVTQSSEHTHMFINILYNNNVVSVVNVSIIHRCIIITTY